MHVEKFLEAARMMRPVDGHLENSHPFARAELRFAHRLDMLIDHLAFVDIGYLERFVGRDVGTYVHPMTPFRMAVADSLHVEVVERFQLDAALSRSWSAQEDLGALRVSGPRSVIDFPINGGR